MKSIQEIVGKKIRECRKAIGLTQTELANKLDKSLRTLQKYENGDIDMPLSILDELVNFFGCSSDYLMGKTDIKTTVQIPKRIMQAFRTRGSDFADFIEVDDIFQKPILGRSFYFVLKSNFDKILEIYDTVYKVNPHIMDKEAYINLFKLSNYEIRQFNYDASGYQIKPAKYKIFNEIYIQYVNCYIDRWLQETLDKYDKDNTLS